MFILIEYVKIKYLNLTITESLHKFLFCLGYTEISPKTIFFVGQQFYRYLQDIKKYVLH